ncbi:MAG: hypothetical protein IH624_04050 [Phycisphaerae bacterium]|nr:hypothetical protein [Phycisphaerae bacterium]
MKSFRGVCFAAQVVLVLGSAGVFAQLEGQWKVDLQFEESDVVRRVEHGAIRVEERPSFVGEVYFRAAGVSSSDAAGMSSGQDALLRTLARKAKLEDWHQALSVAAIEGFRDERIVYVMELMQIAADAVLRSEPNDVWVWSVYGRNRKEVEAVARAALEQLNKKAFEKLEGAKRDLERYKESVGKLEKEIAALGEERKDLFGKFKQLKKKVRYENVEGARMSVDEGLKALQLIEIEVAGIRAKRAELERHMGLESYPEMRAAMEIELAGAMARKEAAEGFVQRGRDFISWQGKIARIPDLLEQKQKLLTHYRERQIPGLEGQLAKPGWDMLPVKLTRQTVLIHPLEFE